MFWFASVTVPAIVPGACAFAAPGDSTQNVKAIKNGQYSDFSIEFPH
jgi:hypothetical protein